jgi:metal-responsive CopG/Arc/MetJ family transcriptional regulator
MSFSLEIKKPEMVVAYTWIPKELKEKLEEIAQKNKVSLSAIIRNILQQAVEIIEKENGKRVEKAS